MEIWAEANNNNMSSGGGQGGGGDVQFLCVCVESLSVAKQFTKMFHFRHALNSYIPARQYFPKGYGQLGCSGFIIADAQGNFVSRKTRAFLQYGENAFAHVEQLLDEQRRLRATAAAGRARGHVRVAGKIAETATATTTTTTPATTTTTTMEDYYSPPPSVGVDVMDHEHQACATALKELFLRRTRAALQRVIQQLENHFAHEEALMVSYRFGGDGAMSEFSALNSHVKDHQRILQIGRDELQRMLVVEQEQQQKESSCSSSSSTTP